MLTRLSGLVTVRVSLTTHRSLDFAEQNLELLSRGVGNAKFTLNGTKSYAEQQEDLYYAVVSLRLNFELSNELRRKNLTIFQDVVFVESVSTWTQFQQLFVVFKLEKHGYG